MQARASILALVPFLAGCATTGATFRSGVGTKDFEHPPYYAGATPEAVALDSTRLAHVPIAFQRGATQPASFDPRDDSGSPIQSLLAEMNAYLDSLGVSTRVASTTGAPSPVAQASRGAPPDVSFGCKPELGLPGHDCAAGDDAFFGRKKRKMELAVGRPSTDWIAWMRGALDDAQAARALVITLEVSQYVPLQEGFLGHKVLELGNGHTAKLPWLTSVDTPVSVLQLTGAVVDREGKAVRIGAEGFYAHRTRLLVSAVGGQELLSDEDVNAVRAQRREDLPGQPLAWRVALRELVSGLTSR